MLNLFIPLRSKYWNMQFAPKHVKVKLFCFRITFLSRFFIYSTQFTNVVLSIINYKILTVNLYKRIHLTCFLHS